MEIERWRWWGVWAGIRVALRALKFSDSLLLVAVVQAEKVAKKLKANAVSGYNNDLNPFGDPNLTEKYVNFSSCNTSVTFLSRERILTQICTESRLYEKTTTPKSVNNSWSRGKPV